MKTAREDEGFVGMVRTAVLAADTTLDRANRITDAILAAIEARDTEHAAELREAVELLREAVDGGTTEYNVDVANIPVCGFCGYEVEDCEAQNWSECGDRYDTLNPCPGIRARAFLTRHKGGPT